MNFEQTVEFYNFLRGEIPEGFHLGSPPKLDKDTAFSIIYVLQEKFGAIPDAFDKCYRCGDLYDSYSGGGNHYEEDGVNLCDGCEDYVLYRVGDGDYTKLADYVKKWYDSSKQSKIEVKE